MKSMIKVSRIKLIARICIFLLIRLLIVSHFGRNPKNGGSPPRDKKFIMIVILSILLEFIKLVNWLIKNILFKLKMNVIFNVMIV